jgi:hypothetical protein
LLIIAQGSSLISQLSCTYVVNQSGFVSWSRTWSFSRSPCFYFLHGGRWRCAAFFFFIHDPLITTDFNSSLDYAYSDDACGMFLVFWNTEIFVVSERMYALLLIFMCRASSWSRILNVRTPVLSPKYTLFNCLYSSVHWSFSAGQCRCPEFS